MNDKLSQSQKLLHDSLFELYMQGGLELAQAGSRGLKRELIIDLETSALTPEEGEIIHFCAINRWDPNDEFDEWVKPSRMLTAEAERRLRVPNEQLIPCSLMDMILRDFLSFVDQRIS